MHVGCLLGHIYFVHHYPSKNTALEQPSRGSPGGRRLAIVKISRSNASAFRRIQLTKIQPHRKGRTIQQGRRYHFPVVKIGISFNAIGVSQLFAPITATTRFQDVTHDEVFGMGSRIGRYDQSVRLHIESVAIQACRGGVHALVEGLGPLHVGGIVRAQGAIDEKCFGFWCHRYAEATFSEREDQIATFHFLHYERFILRRGSDRTGWMKRTSFWVLVAEVLVCALLVAEVFFVDSL